MRSTIIIVFLLFSFLASVYSQNRSTSSYGIDTDNKFTNVVDLNATSVKDQATTGTCWSFATTSFIESELLRMGKGEFDLSEMFVVRFNYLNKLKDNYHNQGKGNLGEGSLSHHWMTVFLEEGIVPENTYPGINYNSKTHDHDELNSFLTAVADVPVKKKEESQEYFKIVNSILDTYLGEVPESFTYKGQEFTPKSFSDWLDINPSDYVEITSFTNFPFYAKGPLEIPDNWDHSTFYNVPINEVIEIMDYALSKGYTVNWDGDVSEAGFNHSNGIAVVPETNITQEMRQTDFENSTTTDDHLMHITGINKDRDGKKYYVTKNSWGTERNDFGGYLNMSENYVKAKTIFIMVHKNSIPPSIKAKLGL